MPRTEKVKCPVCGHAMEVKKRIFIGCGTCRTELEIIRHEGAVSAIQCPPGQLIEKLEEFLRQ